jgi:hypothetical protein
MRRLITFDEAQDEFRSNPTNKTAGVYLSVASGYEEDDMIGDDTYHNAIAEVTYWLIYNAQMRKS